MTADTTAITQASRWGSVKVVAFDIDGVLWLGGTPIPGAAEAVEAVRAAGRNVLFVSNNSLLSRTGLAAGLRAGGVEVADPEVSICTRVAAQWIATRKPRSRVHVLGSEGLREEVASAGLEEADRVEDCTYGIVGVDKALSFDALTAAAEFLEHTPFIGTDPDPVYPGPNGKTPGGGPFLAAVETMLGRTAEVVVGKPNPLMLLPALAQLSVTPDECLFIGDSLHTDYALARRTGCRIGLVLSGNTMRSQVQALDVPPDLLLESVAGLPDVMQAAAHARGW